MTPIQCAVTADVCELAATTYLPVKGNVPTFEAYNVAHLRFPADKRMKGAMYAESMHFYRYVCGYLGGCRYFDLFSWGRTTQSERYAWLMFVAHLLRTEPELFADL